MDTITREIILTLTKRVSDLEAAVEVHRTMLKDITQEHAVAAGKSFDPAAFDLQTADAVVHQREKMAMGVEEKVPTPAAPIVLDLPEVAQD